jgi:PhzF family phenazine biosynthesis protein
MPAIGLTQVAVKGRTPDNPAMNDPVLRYAAFTTDPRGGNPAGVVLDASAMDEPEMRRVAAAVGYSETAFLLPSETAERSWRIRYFSPEGEVSFCGHATIATAISLAERDGPGMIQLTTSAGLVRVETVAGPGGQLTATLTSVPPRLDPVEEEDLLEALAALGWELDELDSNLPPKVAFAGASHLVLVAREHDRLAKFRYDFERLRSLMARTGWTTVHMAWAASRVEYHVRNAFPPGGVVEDPATGAAAAAFGAYLRELAVVTPPVQIQLHQGEAMGRPSLLLVDLDPGRPEVRVSGTAVNMGRLSPSLARAEAQLGI